MTRTTKETLDFSFDFERPVPEIIKDLQYYVEESGHLGTIEVIDDSYYDEPSDFRIILTREETPKEVAARERQEKESAERELEYKRKQLERLKKELGVD